MNVLFILADQHNPSFTGCYGGITRTPNLDQLAKEGTKFEYAYTPSPICSPARACLFSGRYVYQNKCWDNCFPYDGEAIPGWGHYFRKRGVHLATIGKLDFAAGKDNGVDSTYKPDDRTSYDAVSLFRTRPLLSRPKYHLVNNWDVSLRESSEHFEQDIVSEAVRWINEERPENKPWILNVNFSKPHSPWHALPEKYKYYRDKINLKEKYLQPENVLHEVDREQSRHNMGYAFDIEHVKDCHAAYNAIVEEHDENVGAVIKSLKDAGIYEDTLIIYSADHGEMLRAHGAWEKFSMYEDSIRIPMIIKYPKNVGCKCVSTPVSLIDVFPTINQALGFEAQEQFEGESVINLIQNGDGSARNPVFSESHSNGRITGCFAIRSGKWKYIHYEYYEPLLFDLENDPQELNNLADKNKKDPYINNVILELESILNEKIDTDKVTEQAFIDQENLKQELNASGQLKKELAKRGFSYDGKNLYYLP